MATLRECRAALSQLSAGLTGADQDVARAVDDRTVSCRVTDLDVTFRGRLAGGTLTDITEAISSEPAQVRLTVSSDDLVDLVGGRLAFASAWASGRLKLDASFSDLLKLRTLLR